MRRLVVLLGLLVGAVVSIGPAHADEVVTTITPTVYVAGEYVSLPWFVSTTCGNEIRVVLCDTLMAYGQLSQSVGDTENGLSLTVTSVRVPTLP